jgi:dimeric dUTPase (all-alpha-NTP-PPase superfamily)
VTYAQLLEMARLQDRLNCRVNPHWADANYPWGRAIFMECAELMDHMSWKWWKAETPSPLPQLQLEVVDIWHFMLSSIIVLCKSPEAAAEELSITWQSEAHNRDWLSSQGVVEKLAAEAVNGPVSVRAFRELMARMKLDDAQLYRVYLGKNVLNFFRADHGYKEGTYVKTWHGREDNEVLEALMGQTVTPTFDGLYAQLEAAYPKA